MTLVYELLDAHADTADLAAELASTIRLWGAHLEYLRALQREGRRGTRAGSSRRGRLIRTPDRRDQWACSAAEQPEQRVVEADQWIAAWFIEGTCDVAPRHQLDRGCDVSRDVLAADRGETGFDCRAARS